MHDRWRRPCPRCATMWGTVSTLVSVLVLAGVLLVVWYAVVLGAALATRPRDLDPGPPTMELGSEPPAVVNLLVTRCELTADAADATLLDLAARRILELHQPGDDPGRLLVRVRVAEPAGLSFRNPARRRAKNSRGSPAGYSGPCSPWSRYWPSAIFPCEATGTPRPGGKLAPAG